jgi:predicted AAA+ superfamily ATPase
MAYIARLVDDELKRRLGFVGAVEIAGPKWCGKTTTGKQVAKSHVEMDKAENATMFSISPDSVMSGEFPRLIDEWQDVPKTWDRARRIIDDANAAGLFIFTDSATPGQAPSHSGAGRFSSLRMDTLTLWEAGVSSGAVSLRKLFAQESFDPVASKLDYKRIIELMCRGGWPGALGYSVGDAMQLAKDYITAVVERDARKATGINHDSLKLRLFIRSLARNIATPVKISTIAADIAASEGLEIAPKTLDSYFDALRKVYLLEEIPGFAKNLRSKARMRLTPTRHLADVSLAIAALGANQKTLEADPKTTGLLFESFCMHELWSYSRAIGAELFQYHDDNGFEIDAIMRLEDGRWGAIEIKLGTDEYDKAAANLCDLRNKAISVGQAPSFLMILTATSGISATRDDKVHVVAIDALRE